MKYINKLGKEGKLTVRNNEDRGKPEHALKKDQSLDEAAVCLKCQLTRCSGEKKCYCKEADRRKVEEARKVSDDGTGD